MLRLPELILSQKGTHPKLVHDERLFRFNRAYKLKSLNQDVEYFVCDTCSSKRITVSTRLEDDNGVYRDFISDSGAHELNCFPDQQGVINALARQLIMENARIPIGSTRTDHQESYLSVRDQVPVQYRAQIPSYSQMRRSMDRAAHENIPLLPESLEAFNTIPDTLVTVQDQPFVLFFNSYTCERYESTQKILCFATEQDCRHLCSAERVFMDGTFQIVPFPFDGRAGQLFTLSTLFGAENTQHLYMRVYVLCSQRTLQMYKVLFEQLFSVFSSRFGINTVSIRWKTITCDFEIALRSIVTHLNDTFFNGRSDHLLSFPTICLTTLNV